MLNRFIHFVLHQRLLIILATVLLVIGGVFSWKLLPIDAFPDVSNVQVMILTEAPGLSPLDVEQQVTYPIELAMQGLPRIKLVRSLSKAALSQVVVVFEDGVDTYFSRQLVFERLQAAKEQLPAWANPEMGPISTGLGEIYQYTLESDRHSLMELRTIQDWHIAPRLRNIPGVNEVNSFGGFVKQYHVLVDQDRLLKYGITLPEVLNAIEHNNANAGGNFLIKDWEQSYVRSIGLIQHIEDIGNIVLHAEDGSPVFLRDLAEIQIGPETRQGAVTRDGKGERVAGMTIMLKDENSKYVVDAVKKTILNIQKRLPEGVTINPFYDRTDLIQACISTLTKALLLGGVFVILVIFIILGNFRASIIVALSLPLTALAAFVMMGWQQLTANLMSLGGLAIALGMIVDATIIVSENIIRHLGEKAKSGLSRIQIVCEAVSEVSRPVFFSALTIVIVFLPMFSLQQMEGKMFRPMALTMIFALGSSLIISLTIVPVLSSFFVRGQKEDQESPAIQPIKRAYMMLLRKTLNFPKTFVAIAVLLLGVAFFLISRMGTEFLPQLDEGAIAINVVRLPSASLEGSVAVGSEIEQRLLTSNFPEIKTVVTKTGRPEISEDPMGPEQNDIIIILHPRNKWERSKEDLIKSIEKEVALIPGIRPAFSQPIALRVNELVSGQKSDLAIKFFGNDLELLLEKAVQASALVQNIQGAKDINVEKIAGFSQIEIDIDRKAIARHKINIAEINEIVETAIGGKIASTIVEGQMRFAVLVRFPTKLRHNMDELKKILIPSPAGAHIPLGELAHIHETPSPAQIRRENSMRRVSVQCNIRGRDTGSFVKEVQEKLRPILTSLPEGNFIEYGGQFENQQRAMKRLSIVVPVAIMLIFLILFSAFDSLKCAFLVMSTLPFSLVGGIFATQLLGIPLSVSSTIGFIVLFGIAVQDGTLLVSFFDQFKKDGMPLLDAIRRACALRFPSVLTTSLTTILGLLPMVLSSGTGSEIQRPLALVVLAGMISATLLTLMVLPALYYLIEKRDDCD